MKGAIMTEFVGLRAKMYALCVDSKKDIKKTKGVKNEIGNVQWLYAVFKWHNWNDAQAFVHKIEIAQSIKRKSLWIHMISGTLFQILPTRCHYGIWDYKIFIGQNIFGIWDIIKNSFLFFVFMYFLLITTHLYMMYNIFNIHNMYIMYSTYNMYINIW